MIATRCVAIVVSLFLILPVIGQDAAAEYLLQSARQFTNPYALSTGVADLRLEDVTRDGILDVVIVGSYDEEWTPLVTTMPGLGDGTFGEAVITDSPLPNGTAWRLVTVDLNGDPHPDLFVTFDDYDIGEGVATMLGDGDGSFTLGDTLTFTFPSYQVAAGDVTGNGHTDLVVPEASYSSPAMRIYQGAGDGTISEFSTIPLDEEPNAVAVGDFDNDGDLDIACGLFSDHAIRLLLNDGSGTFTIHTHDAPSDVEYLVAGDLNNDGCDDLVASAYYSYDYVWVYHGSAGGTFGPYTSWPFGEQANHMNLGDLDNDGYLDLVASGDEPIDPFGPPRTCVILNDGSGGFGDPHFFYRQSEHLRLGDMDEDGALDAVMEGSTSEHIAILPGLGDGTFSSMTDIMIEDVYAWGVGSADVDGDGDVDLAMADPGDDYAARILRNNGDGTFAGPESYYAGSSPRDLFFGDLDGDRLPEMVIINDSGGGEDGVSVMLNAGDGTFYDRRGYTIGYYTSDADLGDLDGDGDLDIAVCRLSELAVLINPGNGIFPVPVMYPTNCTPADLSLGDMDGDGDLDAVLNHDDWDGKLMLLSNNGDGSFSAPIRIADVGTEGLCLADFDGDGDLDAAAANNNTGEVVVLLNDGAANFTTHGQFPCGRDIMELAAGDIDLDGRIDIVAANERSEDIVLLRGLGGGDFGPPESYPAGRDPRDVSLADFDGDGALDVLTDATYEISASIFFNSGSLSGLLATGPGRGEFNPSLVRIFPAAANGDPSAQWPAYGIDRWGVNVALGELTGSGAPEVLTGAGPGAVFGPHVRGFDIEGTPLPGVSYLAYGTNKYGVNVASGDLDNDGYHEIVTGAGPGAVFGPHVRGWNWDGGGTPQPIPGISYFAYGTPKYGVNVSCGDIDGDGFDEIVTGAGPGTVYGPHVRGWNCDGGGASSISAVSFLAYGTNQWGVNVCCGDIDGDGIDELVTGAGPGVVFGPHVRGWNWDGTGSAQAIPAVSFFAYSYTQWGANVGCGDLDDDGIDEIITGPGPGPDLPARVRGFNYDGQALTALGGTDFLAYEGEGNRHGVKVAGAR